MFHIFRIDIAGHEPPRQFTCPFCYTPHPLTVAAAEQVQDYLRSRADWREEIDRGKMFGVLVVADRTGQIGFLAGYSGNIARSNSHEYFVPPVYDLLRPDGFFKNEEAEISEISRRIDRLQASSALREAQERLRKAEAEGRKEIDGYALFMRQSKQRRDELRKAGATTPSAQDRLIAESQFQKAEFRRIKRRVEEAARVARAEVESFLRQTERLKEERKLRSAALQRRLFDCFLMRNGKGDCLSLTEIFERERGELPPGGAGECAAPKLLQHAYLNGYRPLAMGEFWWGDSPAGEVRRHGRFYPACKSKCEPILNFMLEGIDVEPNPLLKENAEADRLEIVCDEPEFCVAVKPEGMPTVPGNTGLPSVAEIMAGRYPEAGGPMIVHRLDMHTSGLLVVTKTPEAYKTLQRQFAERTVEKRYEAIVEGTVDRDDGEITLPLRPDYDRRPQQMADENGGKEAVSRFRVLRRYPDGRTRLEFRPITGRTHQLRVHAAHARGLNAPIVGDRLYGNPGGGRLHLHASYLSFLHPATGERLVFTSKPDF